MTIQVDPKLRAYIESLPEDQMQAAYDMSCAARARELDNPEGFKAFFHLITGKELTSFAYHWIEEAYRAYSIDKYLGDEAARGLAKTTVFRIFMCFRIGHEPDKTYLAVQVGDDIAQDTSESIADIIANNAGWKQAFPHVVPDTEKGWGASGYEVKRTDIPYPEWRKLNAGRRDPTFIGLGYKSRAIIGKRVTGMLYVDDILDENNTASEREMETVHKILTGTIFPCVVRGSWCVFSFTPWKENDPVMTITSLDEFVRIKTPIVKVVDKDTPGAFRLDPDDENYYLSIWPSRFPESEIRLRRSLSAKIEFARMYLLDLSKAGKTVFKWFPFPADQINGSWPMVGGADYASSDKNKAGSKADTDYFALAYVTKHPLGGAVVYNGVLERTTLHPALGYVEKAQSMFPGWLNCIVEGDGKGWEFIQTLMLKPGLLVTQMKTGGKTKPQRLVNQLGPMLESGRVKISDADTPFLNELRKELREYPENSHDDAMDAVYWALRGMPDALIMPALSEELPTTQKIKVPNPYLSLGG